jgi:predicted MPP superfamily phosphohydrolase
MNLIRFLIILIIFIVINSYLYIRGWQAMPDNRLVHIIYTLIFLVSSLSFFISVFSGNRLPVWLTLVFEQVGGYYMILFIFLLAGALLGDLLRASNHYFNYFPEWITFNYPQAKLLYFSIVLTLIGILAVIGFFRFTNPSVVEMDLETRSNSVNFKELTIVVASDLHLGSVIRKDRLIEWIELINRQQPDLILLAGDIFDHNYRIVALQQMNRELLKLRATYGVYAIPGNHDYYTGIDRVMDFLKRSGITVLRDQAVIIDDRLAIIGRDDLTNKKRKPLALLLDSLNTELPKVVLDHQPGNLDESVENGIDLHISGHTHNGQIFPFNRIISRIYELGYGYRKTGNTHLYVSSGLGLWGAPIRLGTQSEIVKIHVR